MIKLTEIASSKNISFVKQIKTTNSKDAKIPNSNDFHKKVALSKDGTTILTTQESNKYSLFYFDPSMFEKDPKNSTVLKTDYRPYLNNRLSDRIYDSAFYPHFNVGDPVSCCFLLSARNQPIHLKDTYTNQTRATYKIEKREKIIAPLAIEFSLDGLNIYAGSTNTINIFDINRYGNNTYTNEVDIKENNTKGIVSSITFNQEYSMFGASTLQDEILIYDSKSLKLGWKIKEETNNGIMQIKFTKNGNQIISASRLNDYINVWDIRNSEKCLFKIRRKLHSSQKTLFDINCQNMLVYGDHEGNLAMTNLADLIRSSDYLKSKIIIKSITDKDVVNSCVYSDDDMFLVAAIGSRDLKRHNSPFFNKTGESMIKIFKVDADLL